MSDLVKIGFLCWYNSFRTYQWSRGVGIELQNENAKPLKDWRPFLCVI